MSSLGYARVNRDDQTFERQHEALKAAGVERILDDRVSGMSSERPGLSALLDYAREGDTVTVVALDRFGRSSSGLIATIEQLHERGILLRSLSEGDCTTEVPKMLARIFAALAEYERTPINERP